MFLTPYRTTQCSSIDVKGIQGALQRHEIHGDLAPAVTPKGSTLQGVVVVPPYVKSLKPFDLPVDYEGPKGLKVAVDVRGFTRATGDSTYKVVAGAEYEGAILRGALTYAWINDLHNATVDMRRFHDLPAKVFVRLLSETIVRHLNLSPADQQGVVAAAGLLYYSNFIVGNDALSADELERITIAVSRISRISPQKVAELYSGDLPRVTDLDSFCDALRYITKNPRLEKVQAAFIITLMGGIWYGGAARRLVAVALEYPPVWLALVYQAATDRSFHGARLTKIVEEEDRNNAKTIFARQIVDYLELDSNE